MTTPSQRLYGAAHGAVVDRAPCICPGGMMNMVVTALMDEADSSWPQAHCDAQKMAALARTLYHIGGFENYGVPFCMTVEAEALGAQVDLGDRAVEPHVVHAPLASALELAHLCPFSLCSGRVPTVLESIRILKAQEDCVPIVGNLTGPVSIAGTVVDMGTFLKELRKQPQACHDLLTTITDALIAYGQAQVAAGAEVICLSEPSGTGEILGAKRFEEFALPYINRTLDAISVPTKIVHICGRLHSIYPLLSALHCDVFSFDALVDVVEIKPYLAGKAVMGNVSTHAIGTMSPEKVAQLTHLARRKGADILSPACGLPLSAPLENIRAMVAAAQDTEETHHA